jgi:hypothetical protein
VVEPESELHFSDYKPRRAFVLFCHHTQPRNILKLDCQGLNPGPTTYQLCDLGQDALPLYTSVSSTVQWDNNNDNAFFRGLFGGL